MFEYTNNAMVISGQVFFPILFALMVIYLSWRNSEATQLFRGPHLLILGLSVISLLVTIAGVIATIWYLYPSVYVYYASFLILIVELALVIAALPKKEKKERKVSTRQQRRKRGTNLVATAKNSQPKD